MADWSAVLLSNDVEIAYDCFWSVYKNLYQTNFPMKRKRFNRNYNALNKFMTPGLIISRRTKNNLHTKAIADPLPANINKYKAYKTVYQRLVRAAKKLYIADKLTANASNPKKTWQTLNEILGRQGKSDSVTQIKVNDEIITDNERISNHFNTFFSSIGKKISESVPPVTKKT